MHATCKNQQAVEFRLGPEPDLPAPASSSRTDPCRYSNLIRFDNRQELCRVQSDNAPLDNKRRLFQSFQTFHSSTCFEAEELGASGARPGIQRIPILLPVCRLCYNQAVKRSRRTPGERTSAMKTKAEILKILQKEKPELVRRYGLKRLALFGSYAREDQRENSDVDILVEIEPSIGLRFVELADRIEDALGIRTEVVSRRAIKPRYWEIIQGELVDVP